MAEKSETSAILKETPMENPTIQEVPISESSQPKVAQPLEPPESSASERAQPLEPPPSSSAEAPPKRRGRPAGTKDAIKRKRKPISKPVKVTAPSSDTSPSPVATPPRPLNRFERRAALFDSWFQ